LAARLKSHFQHPTEIRTSPDGQSATAFILDPATDDSGLGLGVRIDGAGALEYKVVITAAFVEGSDFGQKTPRAGYAFFVCPSADEAWATMLAHLKPSTYATSPKK
jgi:hypothetical protein